MRVLDLGCGFGVDSARWGIRASDEITGIDVDERKLEVARQRFPDRTYLHAAGERLPFPDHSFDRVISALALPYMDIPTALAEIQRILVPGGSLSVSLHLPSFTWAELRQTFPRPVPTVYRLYVLGNGMWFHCTGRTVKFMTGRIESFQTERGMRLALQRGGFANVAFGRAPSAGGEMFLVEARSKA
jgi:ubiquinone/menaquinone biosynthesis C-methylase UbiE